jgi:putative oxidoreductase
MSSLYRASRLAISPLPVPTAWYAIPLRLIVGFGFVQHGYAKLARGPEHFINLLHAMGLPGDFLLGWATIVVEIIGGLLILLGALVPLATLPMGIVLLVAIVTVHLPNGFSSIKLESFDAAGAHFGQPGYETDLLYLAGLVALCFGGAGPLSIDGILRRCPLLFRLAHNDGEHDDRDAACARCSLARAGSAANHFAFSTGDAEQNLNPLNGAAKLALDGAQANLDHYGEIVSEVHRRSALLAWRGRFHAANDGTSELAQRAIDTYLAHAAVLAEIGTKLQLECEIILLRSARNSSNFTEPHAHNGP